jgi:hypothetical protein
MLIYLRFMCYFANNLQSIIIKRVVQTYRVPTRSGKGKTEKNNCHNSSSRFGGNLIHLRLLCYDRSSVIDLGDYSEPSGLGNIGYMWQLGKNHPPGLCRSQTRALEVCSTPCCHLAMER